MAFQGLGEPRALELANPSQALLSPLPQPCPSSEPRAILHITRRQKQRCDRKFGISHRLPLLGRFFRWFIPRLSLRNIFNQHRPLVTTSPLTRHESRSLSPSPPPLSDNTLSHTSLRGAEPHFHYPKCQDCFLSVLSTAGPLRQPFGESKWNKAPTNNCVFPGPGLTRCPCRIRSRSPPPLFLGVTILISRVSR